MPPFPHSGFILGKHWQRSKFLSYQIWPCRKQGLFSNHFLTKKTPEKFFSYLTTLMSLAHLRTYQRAWALDQDCKDWLVLLWVTNPPLELRSRLTFSELPRSGGRRDGSQRRSRFCRAEEEARARQKWKYTREWTRRMTLALGWRRVCLQGFNATCRHVHSPPLRARVILLEAVIVIK